MQIQTEKWFFDAHVDTILKIDFLKLGIKGLSYCWESNTHFKKQCAKKNLPEHINYPMSSW